MSLKDKLLLHQFSRKEPSGIILGFVGMREWIIIIKNESLWENIIVWQAKP